MLRIILIALATVVSGTDNTVSCVVDADCLEVNDYYVCVDVAEGVERDDGR